MKKKFTKTICAAALCLAVLLVLSALISTTIDTGARIMCGISGVIICLSICSNALQQKSLQKATSDINKKDSYNALDSRHPDAAHAPAVPCEEEQEADLFITTEDTLAKFMQQYAVIDERRTKVVGVTYRNDDGSNRQSVLAHCHAGDDILLRYFEYHGAPAYGVQTEYGQIGNLSEDLAWELEQYGDDIYVSGRILSVTGGSNGQYFGCNIVLKIYGPR